MGGLGFGYWLSLIMAVPAAGFLVRLFMIQHDCGHGAFFRRRAANDWVGRAIGALTLTPYDVWRRSHAVHHASSGNLEQRGIGDINTLTVREYLALSRWRRLGYRLYRNPIVMFGLGPAYLFILQHRLPIGLMRGGWQPWISTMATNAAIALVIVVMMWLVGVGPFLLVHLPITLLAPRSACGCSTSSTSSRTRIWAEGPAWTLHEAALHGSSHYDLPRRPALVHRQHRRAPRAPSLQPHSLLPAPARLARSSGTRSRRPAHAAAESRLRAPGAVG